MKIKTLLVALLGSLFLASCFEDDSSLNYKLMNPIVIDLGDEPTTYKVFAFDTLEIKPITYKEGVPDADLSFKWTLEGNTIIPKVIDSTMTLKYMVDVSAQNNAYKLVYEVRDNTTDIIQEQVFDVTVMSPFGSGLIVCDTKDEMTSDVSLIMAYNFTDSYRKEQDTVMRNLFSSVNGRKINGVATAVRSTTYQVNRSLTIGTDHTLDRVDPFNYSYIDGNGDMFVIDPGQYNVTTIGYDPQIGAELLAITGKIYPRSMQQDNKVYSYYLQTSDMSDYYMGIFYRPAWENGIGFDEKNGRLLEFDSDDQLKVFNSAKLPADAPFDQNKLQGFTCLAMFSGDDSQMHIILKEKDPKTGKAKTNGKIYSYITLRTYDPETDNGKPLKIIDLNSFPEIQDARFFEGTETQNVIYYATSTKIYSINLAIANPLVTLEYTAPEGEEITSMMAGKPLKIIDLNSFPEIQDARFFEGTETQNVIYYATSTKIYSINLAIANPLVTLEYTAPEGEEITSMMAWKEYQGKVDYTNPNPNADADDKVIEVSNNNRMIVLSTYNPSSREGFVRTVAIATLGTGTLEKNRELHGEFGGFGRITATNIQKAF